MILSYGSFTATKDLRRDWTCTPFKWHVVNGTEQSDADIEANKVYFTSAQLYERYFAKFRQYFGPLPARVSSQSPVNWPVVRYSDVLLMLAEAENYLNGPTALAYSCINR
ncbi:RagB/SusD family nutrient uptake outer membrane protein [Mucilaginibacter humi]|uniref:RagB/SusD family nutrient uptake outer membrane protein n=1 Tax=Mucilaginibacter humi TaxID=2732510 RepID=UPI001C2DF1F7|nr:RagB/SusD family nutrient uptake outer membrane protein [Mucilaginibacter humi]